MEVRHFSDVDAFADRAMPFLLADEARHNLQASIVATLKRDPEYYPKFDLWTVEDGGEVVATASLTPPFNLALVCPSSPDAAATLARWIHARGQRLPGVVAPHPEVEQFVAAWIEAAGTRAHLTMAQGVYRALEVRPPTAVPGRMRDAGTADRELAMAWIDAFGREALAAEQATQSADERLAIRKRFVEARLSAKGGGIALWEHAGEPVSLVGYGGYTENGARIGPVYTPPERRGQGFASALTAAVSERLLRGGRRFCFLYTDLSNPTSNRIYQRIGYERVCDSAEYRFA